MKRPRNWEKRISGDSLKVEHIENPEFHTGRDMFVRVPNVYLSVDQAVELIDKLYEFVQYYSQEEP